eukprot:11650211-Alexandrium_andersonii.AAC.1
MDCKRRKPDTQPDTGDAPTRVPTRRGTWKRRARLNQQSPRYCQHLGPTEAAYSRRTISHSSKQWRHQSQTRTMWEGGTPTHTRHESLSATALPHCDPPADGALALTPPPWRCPIPP